MDMPWQGGMGVQIKEVSTKAQLSTGLLLVLSSNLNLPSPSLMMDARVQLDDTLHVKKSHFWGSMVLRPTAALSSISYVTTSPWQPLFTTHSAQCHSGWMGVYFSFFYCITVSKSNAHKSSKKAQFKQLNATNATDAILCNSSKVFKCLKSQQKFAHKKAHYKLFVQLHSLVCSGVV